MLPNQTLTPSPTLDRFFYIANALMLHIQGAFTWIFPASHINILDYPALLSCFKYDVITPEMTHPAPLHIQIPSLLTEVVPVHAKIMHYLSQTGYSTEMKTRVELAVIEALTNAIRHGNMEDPVKQVQLEMQPESTTLTCVITDQGDGFDPDVVPDPIASEHLLKTGGRGVYLMKEMADKVDFEDAGRRVRLIFRE